jgi:hypothetical protein
MSGNATIALGKLGRGGTKDELAKPLIALLQSSGCNSRLTKVEQTGQ